MQRTSQQAYYLAKMFSLALSLIVLSHHGAAKAADWPQWRGPNRDGICSETGLLGEWYCELVIDDVDASRPLGLNYSVRLVEQVRPTLMWTIHGLGVGYSSVSIAEGKLYTMGDVEVDSKKVQCVLAYDLSTRSRLWAAPIGPPHDDGPRCTPTVDGGLIYAAGTSGDVVCIDAETGKVRWSKNLQEDLGGKNPGWKYSESPLVDGDKLVCTPGGRDAVMAALNKKTGDILWKCSMPDIGRRGKDEAGYSSIVASQAAEVRQYIQLTNKGLIGVAAKDGRFLWGYNKVANSVANISTPVVYEDYVFCSTAYNTGSALLKMTPDSNGGVKAEEVYWLDENKFQNHHGGFVKIGDYLYGGHGHNMGKPTCVEFKTGKIRWQAEMPRGTAGSACVMYADGNLYFRYENDVVALVQATPDKYNLRGLLGADLSEYISDEWKEGARVRLNITANVAVLGPFSVLVPPGRPVAGRGRPAWAHPVISDGKLYLRHGDELFCYDVRAR